MTEPDDDDRLCVDHACRHSWDQHARKGSGRRGHCRLCGCRRWREAATPAATRDGERAR